MFGKEVNPVGVPSKISPLQQSLNNMRGSFFQVGANAQVGQPPITRDVDSLEDTPEEWGLEDFNDPRFTWPGGDRDPTPDSAVDSYIPRDESYIYQMLSPLETALKMLTYVPYKSRGVSAIAREMVARGRPVSVRYLNLIDQSAWWTYGLKEIPWRFEPHFDGQGVRVLFNYSQPERILWKHLEWMSKYKSRMNEDTHREYMAFDAESRVETFP